MKETLTEIIARNIGPLIFLLVAGCLCFLLTPEVRKDAVLLVIGAALTRIKRTDK